MLELVWFCAYPLGELKSCLPFKVDATDEHPATWLVYLKEYLLSTNFPLKLHIFCISSKISNDIIIQEKNVYYHLFRSIKLSSPKILKYFLNVIFSSYLSTKILGQVKKIKPSVVTQHGTETQFRDLINRCNFPALIWIQGLMAKVLTDDFSRGAIIRKKIENKIYAKQKYFVAPTRDMQTYIFGINPTAKLINLYYPISNIAFQLFNEKIAKEYDIVFVGAIIKRKGIEDLLTATAKVKLVYPQITIKIIGKGEPKYIEIIQEKIKALGLFSNVIFMGYLPKHVDVLIEIKKAKIFVLPTHVDTGPRSIAESMAIGTPVIANCIDGIPDMIENGKTGRLVKKYNTDELATEIINLMNNIQLRERLGTEANNEARKLFQGQKIAEDLIKIYSDLSQSKYE